MKISDYSEEKIRAIAAEVEYEIAQGNAQPYIDLALYDKIFKKTCSCAYVAWFENDGTIKIGDTYPDNFSGKQSKRVTVKSVEKLAKENIVKVVRCFYNNVFILFGETLIQFSELFEDMRPYYMFSTILTSDKIEDIERILGQLERDVDSGEANYYLALKSGQYIITKCYKAPAFDIDIEKNYNDDIPIDTLYNILERKKNDLILFYGVPGGGKTSLIRHLVKVIGKHFIFIDPSLIDSCSSAALVEFLDENKDSIIVLEDCEKLLKDRSEGNLTIGTLLNLTDGIMGELMNVKFLCTFNCPLVEIDKAILRKGRLSLKYEFKELALEKVKKIYPEAKKAMTLADAYNADEENDFSKNEKKTIGFEFTNK